MTKGTVQADLPDTHAFRQVSRPRRPRLAEVDCTPKYGQGPITKEALRLCRRASFHPLRDSAQTCPFSTPQAVWIACNNSTARSVEKILFRTFQYRKRYGLHAIPSLTALGTVEPRSGFSKRSALLGKSPQPRGIFLSPKSAENVRKPCNIKETFVHGKNLKLMAFSPKFVPSL